MIKELIIQNWENVLVLLAFAIMLRTTVFLDKRTIHRMYVLILLLFIFSMIVYFEFALNDLGEMPKVRLVLMAVRYSTTPYIYPGKICSLGRIYPRYNSYCFRYNLNLYGDYFLTEQSRRT